jgi:hypothetical protein
VCFITGCQSSQQKGLENQQSQLAQTQTQVAQQQMQTSKYGLDQLQQSLPSVMNFFQSLVSGGPAAMTALQPAIGSLTSQYENAAVAENEFAPRGGGRTAALGQAPYQEAAQIGNLVASEETAGATGLENIDQLLSNLTTGSASEASSTLSSTSSANLSEQQVLQQQQQQQQQAGASLGSGIGALIALLAA